MVWTKCLERGGEKGEEKGKIKDRTGREREKRERERERERERNVFKRNNVSLRSQNKKTSTVTMVWTLQSLKKRIQEIKSKKDKITAKQIKLSIVKRKMMLQRDANKIKVLEAKYPQN